eukprot:3715227-Rhodomonas_salina.2
MHDCRHSPILNGAWPLASSSSASGLLLPSSTRPRPPARLQPPHTYPASTISITNSNRICNSNSISISISILSDMKVSPLSHLEHAHREHGPALLWQHHTLCQYRSSRTRRSTSYQDGSPTPVVPPLVGPGTTMTEVSVPHELACTRHRAEEEESGRRV